MKLTNAKVVSSYTLADNPRKRTSGQLTMDCACETPKAKDLKLTGDCACEQ